MRKSPVALQRTPNGTRSAALPCATKTTRETELIVIACLSLKQRVGLWRSRSEIISQPPPFEEDETDGFGLTLAVPIPLKAILLTGEVEADQLTPTTGMVAFRIRAKGLKSPFKTQQGKWLAPILVEEQIAAAASSNGTAPKFDNLRTHLRRMGRNATKRELAAGSAAGTSGGKRRADDAEEGEISDGGASRASGASSSMSKLARKAQNGFDIR